MIMCFEEPIFVVDETEWVSQLYCRVPNVAILWFEPNIWKLKLYKFAEFLFPKKQDSGCVGYWVCVPTSTTDLCCQLVMRQIWSKENKGCMFFFCLNFSPSILPLWVEKNVSKKPEKLWRWNWWSALQLNMHPSFLVSHSL